MDAVATINASIDQCAALAYTTVRCKLVHSAVALPWLTQMQIDTLTVASGVQLRYYPAEAFAPNVAHNSTLQTCSHSFLWTMYDVCSAPETCTKGP